MLKLVIDGATANDGLMRRVKVITKPGTIVDAQAPSAVSAGNVETSQRIVDVLLEVFSQMFRIVSPRSLVDR